MRALITNDDGFDSVGLKLLKEFVLSIGFRDVITVAPKTNRSASGHAVSIKKRLKIEKVAEDTFSVDGTPVDCVITAFHDTFLTRKGKPEVVFSGINIGTNLGVDTLLSGTVAAAMLGMLSGVPSFAFSQFYHPKPSDITWNVDSTFLREYVLAILEKKHLLETCLLNINLPHCQVIGIKHVPQYDNVHLASKRGSAVEVQLHHENKEQYITIDMTGSIQLCKFLQSGYATVTPIGCDLANHAALKLLSEEFDSAGR